MTANNTAPQASSDKGQDQYKNYDDLYAKYQKELKIKEELEKELKRL